jgi:adhesin transport system membrane fusion protein
MAAGRRLPITPGMMTDTQIITGRKSVLSYLLKPVLKARSDALRER